MITRICDRCGSTIKENTYACVKYISEIKIMEPSTMDVCISFDLCVLCFIKLKDYIAARELTNV